MFTRGSIEGILEPLLAELHTHRLIRLDPLTDAVINGYKKLFHYIIHLLQ